MRVLVTAIEVVLGVAGGVMFGGALVLLVDLSDPQTDARGMRIPSRYERLLWATRRKVRRVKKRVRKMHARLRGRGR